MIYRMSKSLFYKLIIILNLLIGNGILFFSPDSPNYYLMVGMSIACICSYTIFFTVFDICKTAIPLLLVASVICCIIIVLLGCMIASSITSIDLHKASSLTDVLFINNMVGIVMAIMGNILVFPFTVSMGGGNFLLILLYRFKLSKQSF